MASRELKDYYDRNTALFLRIGSSGGSHAIHRGLWAPGVRNGRDAAEYINILLAERLQDALPEPPRTVLDLGCGVGGTMFSLALRFPRACLHGVTISAKQVAIAREIALQLGLQHRCDFITADFEQLDLDLRADAIVAIESFVHAAQPERFFAACRKHLAPGGRVLIVDDFIAYPIPPNSPAMQRTLDRFRSCWQVPGLCTRAEFETAARSAGLVTVADQDLSPLIRTRRPRDWLVAAASPAACVLGLSQRPFWANVVGGHALNRALRKGWVRYHLLTLTQADASDRVC